MKIAFVYDLVYPFSVGGNEKRLHCIAQALSEKHEVHVFGMKSWHGNAERMQGKVFLHGVSDAPQNLYSENGRRKILPSMAFSFRLFFALLRHDFDVLECQSFPFLPLLSCKLACALKRKTLVVYWVEAWQDYWNEYLGAAGFLGKSLEKFCTRLSPYNLANSAHTKRRLVSLLGLRPEKIRIISPAVCVPESFPRPATSFDVVFAGRLIAHKNPGLLIEAIAIASRKAPGISLAMIGSGPEKENVQATAEMLGMQKNIAFFENLPEQLLFSIVANAKVFVLPSEREGFGMSCLEAMHFGVPALTLDSPLNAAKELVGEKELVCKKDAIDLAGKIVFLLSHERERKALGQKSAEKSRAFSPRNILGQYEDFFAGLQE
ncbi:MAG: glycosyltransferase family 4 protein [Candidatus Diapherotrites archaeon]|nr:glycosyltransferase family 4 protein [Candidatus Diapherotrites archaeon]